MNTARAPAASAETILQLRSLLAEKFPVPPAQDLRSVTSGCAALDAALGSGGLICGHLTELVRPQPGAGATLVLHSIIEGTAKGGGRLALVDASDGLDVDAFDNQTLRSLLWIRCRSAETACKAADWMLRDGNLRLIILDLVGSPGTELRRISSSTWFRLAHAAEKSGCVCLVFTPAPMATSASERLELRGRFSLASLEESRDLLQSELEFGCLRRRHARLPEADNIVPFARAVA